MQPRVMGKAVDFTHASPDHEVTLHDRLTRILGPEHLLLCLLSPEVNWESPGFERGSKIYVLEAAIDLGANLAMKHGSDTVGKRSEVCQVR